MKKLALLILISCSICGNASAKIQITGDINQGNVELQLQAEQWVSTNTALVSVSADATLDKTNTLTQTREQLLKKFAELADNTTWNITTFTTSQSESGLEQMHVDAQARLQESKLTNLREKLKNLSKPGLTLRIGSIDFSPSLAEFETAKANLRSMIYSDAKNEAARLNKVYPDQNYKLYSIVFQPSSMPQPTALNAMAAPRMGDNMGYKAAAAGAGSTAVLAVNTKIEMDATVQLAAVQK